jgi:hypothetical protein
MRLNPIDQRQKKVIQLESLLNAEIPVSGGAVLFLWFMPSAFILAGAGLVLLLLVLFLVVLITLLFQLRKYGWLLSLLVLVVLPLCLIHPLYQESLVYPVHYMIPLAVFIFYSIFLRISIGSWPDYNYIF